MLRSLLHHLSNTALGSAPRYLHSAALSNPFAHISERYPDLLITDVDYIAYSAQTAHPDSLFNPERFILPKRPFYLSTDRSIIDGTICLSLLPEVAALHVKTLPCYLYACHIRATVLCIGGPWRQIALLPQHFSQSCLGVYARPIISRDDYQLILGSTLVIKNHIPLSSSFNTYLTSPRILLPERGNHDPDLPPDFHIQDNSESKDLLKRVEAYRRFKSDWQ